MVAAMVEAEVPAGMEATAVVAGTGSAAEVRVEAAEVGAKAAGARATAETEEVAKVVEKVAVMEGLAVGRGELDQMCPRRACACCKRLHWYPSCPSGQ
jgi:hypothetical protein